MNPELVLIYVLTAIVITLSLWVLLKTCKKRLIKWGIRFFLPKIMKEITKKAEGPVTDALITSERKREAADRRWATKEKKKSMAAMIKLGIQTFVERTDADNPKRGYAQAALAAIETNAFEMGDRLEQNPEAFIQAFEGLTSGNMMQAATGGMKLMEVDLAEMTGNLFS